MGKLTSGGLATRKALLNLNDRMFSLFVEGMEAESFSRAEVNEIKLAFQEYRQVEEEVFKEKGTTASVSDVAAKIPNNIWLRLNLENASRLMKSKKG